jgi:hypothetical protein
MQPKIDWKRGWIDHSQLPIIFRTKDVARAQFSSRTTNIPRESRVLRIGQLLIQNISSPVSIPEQYQAYERVFSKEASHEFPPSRPWDTQSISNPALQQPSQANLYPYPKQS